MVCHSKDVVILKRCARVKTWLYLHGVPDGDGEVGLTGAEGTALQLNKNPCPLLEKSEWNLKVTSLDGVMSGSGISWPQKVPRMLPPISDTYHTFVSNDALLKCYNQQRIRQFF